MSKKDAKKYKCRSDGSLYITRMIEFIPDHDAEIMLKKNCSYRHWLYNKCVEIILGCQSNHPNGYIGVNGYELLKFIRDEFESNNLNNKRPDFLEDYDYYFRGISECVVDDIQKICNRIKTERFNNKSSNINFLKFNKNKMSFRFKNKIHTERRPKSNGLYHGNSIVLTENPYIIGLKINSDYGFPLGLHLRESFSKLNINLNKVKEIAIKYHNEKWYLYLLIDYTSEYSKIRIEYKRKKIAGVDLGETNPVTIYDGKVVIVPKHLQYPKNKISRIDARLKRLQRVISRKYDKNIADLGLDQSNNYYKVLKKYHKAKERKHNIVKDWHYKLAYWIVTQYKNIVVDTFNDYIRRIISRYPTRKRKDINHSMLNKGMSYFSSILKHMCRKYGTNYYLPYESLETTNTCNICGHINRIKLRIDENHNERFFACEHCMYIADRDENASINCYNAFYDKMIIIPQN